MTNQHTTELEAERKAALSLLRRGLCTPAEAARLIGTSRQLVRYWADAEQINFGLARLKHLNNLWKRSFRG